MNRFFYFSLLTLASLFASCTDPTVIGGGLVDGTQLPVVYRDDIPVTLRTDFARDVPFISDFQQIRDLLPFGCIRSDYTGTVTSTVGVELVERSDKLDLSAAVVDSVVLILPLSSRFQLGDTMATASVEVYGATAGTIDQEDPSFSTPLIDNGVLYGETTTVPKRTVGPASVFVGDSLRVDTLGPEMRIQLNQSFRDVFLSAVTASIARDSVVNDSAFIQDFPGIIIKSGTCGGTLPSIDLDGSRNDRMGVFVYYSEGGVQKQYQFNYIRGNIAVGEIRPVYAHDYTGSIAEGLLARVNPGDTIAIAQSLKGLIVRVDIDLNGLSNEAVNLAFLDVPIIPGSDTDISALPRLVVKREDSSNELFDYTANPQSQTGIYSTAEGGNLMSMADPRGPATDSVMGYRFNITSLLQSSVTGDSIPTFYLVPRFEERLPGESILAGTEGDANALKTRLLLATTELP